MAESHGNAKGVAAHTEADAGKKPFPPFQKDTFASQLVSLLIAFVALYLIVSRIALPRVGSLLDERQNAIDGDLAEAQKLKDESDSALKAYESELAAARSRAQAIGTETRDKLNAAAEAERKTLEERWRSNSRTRKDHRHTRSGAKQYPRIAAKTLRPSCSSSPASA